MGKNENLGGKKRELFVVHKINNLTLFFLVLKLLT